MLRFNIAHGTWAGGEDYVKLCELLQKELGQLAPLRCVHHVVTSKPRSHNLSAEESAACWTALVQGHADQSIGTPIRRQDGAAAGPSGTSNIAPRPDLPPPAPPVNPGLPRSWSNAPQSNGSSSSIMSPPGTSVGGRSTQVYSSSKSNSL